MSENSFETRARSISATGELTWGDEQNSWQDEVSETDGVTIEGGRVRAGHDIPDSGNLQSHYGARLLTGYSEGETVDPFTDDQGSNDATAGGGPTFRENEINGQPAVEYDGVNDYHDTGISHDTDGPLSVYAVVNLTDDSDIPGVWYGGVEDPASNRSYFGINHDGDYFLAYGDATNQSISGYPSNEYRLHGIVSGSGSSEWFDNGSSVGTLSYSGQGTQSHTNFIGARNFGGAGNFFTGPLAELLIYQADHDDQTRQDVEAYLNNIYGVF